MTCEKTNMRGSSAQPAQGCIFSIEKPAGYWARTTTKADIEREPADLIRINTSAVFPNRFVSSRAGAQILFRLAERPQGGNQTSSERGLPQRRPSVERGSPRSAASFMLAGPIKTPRLGQLGITAPVQLNEGEPGATSFD